MRIDLIFQHFHLQLCLGTVLRFHLVHIADDVVGHFIELALQIADFVASAGGNANAPLTASETLQILRKPANGGEDHGGE